MTQYLPDTPFADPRGAGYSVEINGDGVTVYSECCASTMSEQTARAVHEALGRWLADRGLGHGQVGQSSAHAVVTAGHEDDDLIRSCSVDSA